MTFLAVDPGWNETGLAVYTDDTPVWSGIMRPDGVDDGYRLLALASRIRAICSRYDVEFVAVESFAYSAKGNAVSNVYGAGYAVRIGACEFGVVDVPIPTWKSHIGKAVATLKASSPRDYTIAIRELTGTKPATINEADALAIGWCVAQWIDGKLKLAGARVVVEKILEIKDRRARELS